MNIFYLDSDPAVAARYHCDKHMKMCLESAQLLSTAHHHTTSSVAPHVYKPTHSKHPCALRVLRSRANYEWLFDLYRALGAENERRYKRAHGSMRLEPYLQTVPDLPCVPFTEPPQCMPGDYKRDDTVEAYRAYYVGDKARFARWQYTPQPWWWR